MTMLNGDEDHIVRIYGPSDEDEAREFLQAVVEMWNDTSRRPMADYSHERRAGPKVNDEGDAQHCLEPYSQQMAHCLRVRLVA